MSKAQESLDAANELLKRRHHGFSASRSYYGIFYAAKAVLLHKDLQFRKHSAVIANFNRHVVKPKVFSVERFKAIERL